MGIGNNNQIENRLWGAADELRANSNLASSEYFMPVLGLIFLRHAFNRFLVVEEGIKKSLPTRGGKTRPIVKEDFHRKSALFLRDEARYDHLLNLSEDRDKGKAIIQAMEYIEEDYEGLKGILPKEYHIFDNDVLTRILKIFNDEALQQAGGDMFGRIYEYFLMKFAMQGAHDGGEFFTPISLVQTIVNVIEPGHGIIFDPACGSGGMFVQTSHFLEETGRVAQEEVTFFGQEKTATTIRLAKMNLAVHGLEGNIVEGNSYYEDHHEMLHKADFVMANPPFNVDSVDSQKVKTDPRLPFGLPGVNKKKAVSNGNYLWISYFYSYLNDTGRAGFVMSSQASSAGNKEMDVRRKIIETGDVDVMISIRSNFFYTRSVPCELWFFDKNKPNNMKDKVLMLDARNVFRKVTRKINDFSPEQEKNLSAIVWLYRGQTDRFLALVRQYFIKLCSECSPVEGKLRAFEGVYEDLRGYLDGFGIDIKKKKNLPEEVVQQFRETLAEIEEMDKEYRADRDSLLKDIGAFVKKYGDKPLESNKAQHMAREAFDPLADWLKALAKSVDHLYKLISRGLDLAEKDLGAKGNGDLWDAKVVRALKKDLDPLRREATDQLKAARYFHRQIVWLQNRFPDAKLVDVEGLVKLTDRKEIEKQDWSLTPGRFVGVAPLEEDEDFDFKEAIRDIHIELEDLNEEAVDLATRIKKNFEELGI